MTVSMRLATVLRRRELTAQPLAVARRNASSSVGAFAPTLARASAVKPGSESEATTPGSGSTEDIANSSGAYDGSKPNPDSATSKIEDEKNVNFDQSSADSETSEAATKAQTSSAAKPSKQQQKTASKSDFGATAARKQGGRGAN